MNTRSARAALARPDHLLGDVLMNLRLFVIVMTVASTLMTDRALRAQVAEYTNFAQWQAAAGQHTTITFTEYPQFTIITDQYQCHGAVFTDGNDFIHHAGAFPQDGAGLTGNFVGGVGDAITVAFTTPMTSIGTHYPGLLFFELYSQGTLIYSSSNFSTATGFFAGLVSSQPFDSAVIGNWGFEATANIDNLYFGPAIPAPPAFVLLGAAGLCVHRRRRC
jgi:MYXO-CTERM domain-containing protein